MRFFFAVALFWGLFWGHGVFITIPKVRDGWGEVLLSPENVSQEQEPPPDVAS